MVGKRDIVAQLTAKDDRHAWAVTEKVVSESRETDEWYGHLDEFAELLEHPKSLVRNRALLILAANAQWDEDGRFDAIMPGYLAHVTDDKPVTARQCIKALAQIGRAQPRLVPQMLERLESADLSKYGDSMRPLVERDIAEVKRELGACGGQVGCER